MFDCCDTEEYVEIAVEKTYPVPLRITNGGPCPEIEASTALTDQETGMDLKTLSRRRQNSTKEQENKFKGQTEII